MGRALLFVLMLGSIAGSVSAAVLAGCQSATTPLCSDLLIPLLTVTVTDAATRLNICNASVLLSDAAGTYPSDEPFDSHAGLTDASCSYYFSLGGATGNHTYTLSVTASGHASAKPADVVVEFDTCRHPTTTKAIAVKLSSS
jgi:hypothetical protein